MVRSLLITARRALIQAGLGLIVLSLTSCGAIPGLRRSAPKPPVIPPMPAWAVQGGEGGTPRVTVSGAGEFEGVQGTPTSATGGMYDFSSVAQTATQGLSQLGWNRSLLDATLQARTEAKPLLVFAAHKSSAPSNAIESTLMIHPEFIELAKSFVMLRIDYSNKEVASADLYRQFKERLKIRGYPNVYILLPDGSEVITLRGYKPELMNRYLTQIRGSLTAVEEQVANRRKRLQTEDRYRLWSTPDGKGFFAKIVKLDANQVTFHTEWDEVLHTFTSRLSPEDQAWIEEKKLSAKPSTQPSS